MPANPDQFTNRLSDRRGGEASEVAIQALHSWVGGEAGHTLTRAANGMPGVLRTGLMRKISCCTEIAAGHVEFIGAHIHVGAASVVDGPISDVSRIHVPQRTVDERAGFGVLAELKPAGRRLCVELDRVEVVDPFRLLVSRGRRPEASLSAEQRPTAGSRIASLRVGARLPARQ
jgi:hypothetical protein